MTVRELVALLNKLPPDAHVLMEQDAGLADIDAEIDVKTDNEGVVVAVLCPEPWRG